MYVCQYVLSIKMAKNKDENQISLKSIPEAYIDRKVVIRCVRNIKIKCRTTPFTLSIKRRLPARLADHDFALHCR